MGTWLGASVGGVSRAGGGSGLAERGGGGGSIKAGWEGTSGDGWPDSGRTSLGAKGESCGGSTGEISESWSVIETSSPGEYNGG